MFLRNASVCLLILLCFSCGFDYKAETLPANAVGGSVSLEIAGNQTSVSTNEGSAIVIVPTLTGTLSQDTPISLTVSSPRNDVGAFFSDTFPLSATITAGSSSTSITLNTVHDVTYTGDMSFVVTVSSPAITGSVVLNLTLTDIEPLVLGSFTINGVVDTAESSDTTFDSTLLDSQTPKLSWATSSHAQSYDVTILDDDGTTVRCATRNTTSTSVGFSSATCLLNYGSFYKARVIARNGSVTESAPLLRFEAKSSAVLTSDSVLMSNTGAAITFDPRTNDLEPGATITAVTTPTRGSATFTGSTVTYSRTGTEPGIVTFNYTVQDSSNNLRNGTVTVKIMAPYSWTGSVSNSFSTAGNWCGSVSTPGVDGSCNGHTVAPGSSTVTYVDLTCSINCSPTISSNQSVQGVRLSGNSLTMSGPANLTVGSSGFIQTGGTFTGASGEVYVQDGNLTLSAGTFTAPTSLRFRRWDFTISNGFNFVHNNGTLLVEGNWDRAVGLNTGSAVFNHVIMNPNSTTFWSEVTGTMIVNGNLTLNHNETGSTYNVIDNGTIQVKGNVTSNDNGLRGNGLIQLTGNVSGQTVSANGPSGSYLPGLKISAGTHPVTITGNIKIGAGLYEMVSSGAFVSSGSTITLGNAGCARRSYSFGNVHYNNLAFGEGCQQYNFQGSTVKIDGDLIIDNKEFSSEIENGTIDLTGNLVAYVGAYGFTSTDTLHIRLIGNPAGQTILSNRSTQLPGIIIDSGSHDVTMTGEVHLRDLFHIENTGTFTPPTELILNSGCYGYGSDGFQAKLSSKTFPYLKIDGGCPYFDFMNSSATVEEFIIEGENRGDLANGTINVTGDLSLLHEGGYRGSLTIAMKGNNAGQVISSQNNDSYIPRLIIDSGTHPVSISGTAPLIVINRYEYLSSGGLTFGSFPLTLGNEDCTGDVTATMGSVTYDDVYIHTYCRNTYFTDSVFIGGDLTFSGSTGSGQVFMPNPGTGYSLTVGGIFTRNGVNLNAYGATVPP